MVYVPFSTPAPRSTCPEKIGWYALVMTSTNLDGLPGIFDTSATLTAPLDVVVGEKTQRLLDIAVEHQETGLCDDIQGWASRLADDVKDAGD